MMGYEIQAFSEVGGDLAAIPKPFCARIRQAIHKLGAEPRPSGAVKMSGYANLYRVRVGQYRVVYFVHDNVLRIVVVATATRGRVYEILKRRIRR